MVYGITSAGGLENTSRRAPEVHTIAGRCVGARNQPPQEPCSRRRTRATSRLPHFTAAGTVPSHRSCRSASPLISRLLRELGGEVIVANPLKIRGRKGRRNHDRIDAEFLARQGHADPKLLYPIEYRGETGQADWVLLDSRDSLVKRRSLLINHVRGAVKSLGGRMPDCSTESFHCEALAHIPHDLEGALKDVLEEIARLNAQLAALDGKIERKA
jgi:transposase